MSLVGFAVLQNNLAVDDRGRAAGLQLGASGLETDFLSEDEADVFTYPKKSLSIGRGLGAPK